MMAKRIGECVLKPWRWLKLRVPVSRARYTELLNCHKEHLKLFRNLLDAYHRLDKNYHDALPRVPRTLYDAHATVPLTEANWIVGELRPQRWAVRFPVHWQSHRITVAHQASIIESVRKQFAEWGEEEAIKLLRALCEYQETEEFRQQRIRARDDRRLATMAERFIRAWVEGHHATP